MVKIPGVDEFIRPDVVGYGCKFYNRERDILRLQLWSCGDMCMCRQFQVQLFKKGSSYFDVLWRGSWICDPDEEEQKEMLEEVKEIMPRYGFKQELPNSIYEIEFLRELVEEEK